MKTNGRIKRYVTNRQYSIEVEREKIFDKWEVVYLVVIEYCLEQCQLLFIEDFVEACNIPRAKVLTINFFHQRICYFFHEVQHDITLVFRDVQRDRECNG